MAEQAEKQNQGAGKRKLPWKTIMALGVVLLLEAGAVSAIWFLMGQPAEVTAEGADLDNARSEQTVEMLLIEDRFQNTRAGRAFIYDATIHILVPQKHKGYVEEKLTNMEAQIDSEIATIFRRAEQQHLDDPEMSTLERQIRGTLNEKFGRDEDGDQYVAQVLMKSMRYPVD